MRKLTRKEFIVSAVVIVTLLVGWLIFLALDDKPEQVSSGLSNSDKSAQRNDAYLSYVRTGNPELETEPGGSLLRVGYKICGELHSFSELTLVNMADIQYTGAGQRIYDGATQYLCQEGG
jgi:hypothetical protein